MRRSEIHCLHRFCLNQRIEGHMVGDGDSVLTGPSPEYSPPWATIFTAHYQTIEISSLAHRRPITDSPRHVDRRLNQFAALDTQPRQQQHGTATSAGETAAPQFRHPYPSTTSIILSCLLFTASIFATNYPRSYRFRSPDLDIDGTGPMDY